MYFLNFAVFVPNAILNCEVFFCSNRVVSILFLLQIRFDDCDCVQIKRRQIVSTLVDSEKSYVESLRRLCEASQL